MSPQAITVATGAIHSLEIAANQGDPTAQFQIGLDYEKGLDVQRDYKLALTWYRKAADQWSHSALYRLGYLYENGLGVTASDSEARRWYQKAADLGDVDANAALQRLKGK
jgi:TPR repeat protein